MNDWAIRGVLDNGTLSRDRFALFGELYKDLFNEAAIWDLDCPSDEVERVREKFERFWDEGLERYAEHNDEGHDYDSCIEAAEEIRALLKLLIKADRGFVAGRNTRAPSDFESYTPSRYG